MDKRKQKVNKENEDYEVERDFEIIQVHSDEENEEIITNMLLQDRNAQIKDLLAHLERAKSINDALDLENRQLGAQMEIYEARALKAWKEAKKAQIKIEELISTYEESSDKEVQSRRRPITMGLKKALAKQREEESALAEQISLNELLAMEI